MASRFAFSEDDRRELGALFMRTLAQVGGRCSHVERRIHEVVRRYESTGWPREKILPSPINPRNAAAHAILRRMGRAPSATAIHELLFETGMLDEARRLAGATRADDGRR